MALSDSSYLADYLEDYFEMVENELGRRYQTRAFQYDFAPTLRRDEFADRFGQNIDNVLAQDYLLQKLNYLGRFIDLDSYECSSTLEEYDEEDDGKWDVEISRHRTKNWFHELIILVDDDDLERALCGERPQGPVMYVWNDATSDLDLIGFLKHRRSIGRSRHLIVVGGAHGRSWVTEVETESPKYAKKSQADPPKLDKEDFARAFRRNEKGINEWRIMKAWSRRINVHYVDLADDDNWVKQWTDLHARYPNSDVMICVCFGLSTDLARGFRDKGLDNALVMKDLAPTYVKIKVNWETKFKPPPKDIQTEEDLYRTYRYNANKIHGHEHWI